MSTKSSISYTNIDFDSYKQSLKNFLRSQDRFKDYDFDGSNMSVLLDILAYNSMNNAFYLNMVSKEMYLDSAQLRDSVVSHAKELNYTPRSFRSSQALVNIEVKTDASKTTLLIPKGSSFTSRIGTRNFNFSVNENIIMNLSRVENGFNVFRAERVELYEGDFIADTFVYSDSGKYVLSNKNIDTTSINVVVIEDNGAITTPYRKATSLIGVDSNSPVYFVQGAQNEKYEILFGDGVSGKTPKNSAVIVVEYRVCNGELSNGCSVFKSNGPIDGETNIVIETLEPSIGGYVAESIESIKFNAPRHFTTQERAITTEDYENLIRQNFPEVNSVSAYGGEDLVPPQYGKVFVAVDLKDFDGLPETRKNDYQRFLRSKSPVSIEVTIQSPEYLYLEVTSLVKYNVNLTQLNVDDIRTLVVSAILEYAESNLNNFNKTTRLSRLIRDIDDAHFSIISNITSLRVSKRVNLQRFVSSNSVEFGVQIVPGSIDSQEFVAAGQSVRIKDDSNGRLVLVNSTNATVRPFGQIDYVSGRLTTIGDPTIVSTDTIKIYAASKDSDISTNEKTILNITEEDLIVQVERIRE